MQNEIADIDLALPSENFDGEDGIGGRNAPAESEIEAAAAAKKAAELEHVAAVIAKVVSTKLSDNALLNQETTGLVTKPIFLIAFSKEIKGNKPIFHNRHILLLFSSSGGHF